MQLIAVTAMKGGTGRTTAVMALAAALDRLGKRTVLLDTDPLAPLVEWQATAVKATTWSDRCHVHATPDLSSLDRAYAAAEADGADLVLVDLNAHHERILRAVVPNATMVLITTAPTPLDLQAATAAYQRVVELLLEAEARVETALLFSRMPDRDLTATERNVRAALDPLPHTQAMLTERDPFAAMPDRGLLHRMSDTAPSRFLRRGPRPIERAIDEADALAAELLERIDG